MFKHAVCWSQWMMTLDLVWCHFGPKFHHCFPLLLFPFHPFKLFLFSAGLQETLFVFETGKRLRTDLITEISFGCSCYGGIKSITWEERRCKLLASWCRWKPEGFCIDYISRSHPTLILTYLSPQSNRSLPLRATFSAPMPVRKVIWRNWLGFERTTFWVLCRHNWNSYPFESKLSQGCFIWVDNL